MLCTALKWPYQAGYQGSCSIFEFDEKSRINTEDGWPDTEKLNPNTNNQFYGRFQISKLYRRDREQWLLAVGMTAHIIIAISSQSQSNITALVADSKNSIFNTNSTLFEHLEASTLHTGGSKYEAIANS